MPMKLDDDWNQIQVKFSVVSLFLKNMSCEISAMSNFIRMSQIKMHRKLKESSIKKGKNCSDLLRKVDCKNTVY